MRILDDWLLTPQRIAVHMPTHTAVIADLHLGYNETRRQQGEAIPLVSMAELLEPLRQVQLAHGVTRLAVAGDLFEETVSNKLLDELLTWLGQQRLELIGIAPGNHDDALSRYRERVPLMETGVPLGNWRVLHGHGRLPKEPIVHGHVHPCWRLGRRVSAPCYLAKPNRLVLPAYSQDAAGVNVLSQASWHQYDCYVLTADAVLAFGKVKWLAKKN